MNTSSNTRNKKKRTTQSIDSRPAKKQKTNSPRPAKQSLQPSLHREIIDFCKTIQPSSVQIEKWEDLIKRLKKVVTTLWRRCQLEVFGSYSTNLALSTSDIDCVVTGDPPQLPGALWALSRALVSQGISDQKDIQVIVGAKVPIVKCIDRITSTPVDICFQEGGIQNCVIVKDLLTEFGPVLRLLVLFLKFFLKERGLNEPVSGGIGSYCLVLMVTSFLQQWRLQYGDGSFSNLGVLLVRFFELYGTRFNYYTTGISVKDGSYFNKAQRGWHSHREPYRVSIEDPNDNENDVGMPTKTMLQVRAAFAYAYLRLTHCPKDSGSSFLSKILSVESLKPKSEVFMIDITSDE